MTTAFIVINALITIAALVLCIRAWRGLRSVSKPQPRAGYKHSALERRRKSLELATKEWNRKLSRGHIFLAGEQKHLVDQLEREVAALEDELFGTAEEATPKPEAPKRNHVITIRYKYDKDYGWHYHGRCSLCDWCQVSFSSERAEAKRAAHERKHA